MLVSPFRAIASLCTASNGELWPSSSPASDSALCDHSKKGSDGVSTIVQDADVLLPASAPALPAASPARPPHEDVTASSQGGAATEDLAAQINATVMRHVEAHVGRLRVEFQKRETMLMQAVMSHAERERELMDRMAALERKLQAHQQQRLPDS